ncbi:MAG: hypothetical protein A2Y81_12665 [Nitrospirae bacterium RBG_13_43_8]|nr:MAG: hypothetical protein A2Y81_12665 [Nitrospirae bacterium RBG_13_43_8]
MRSTEQIAKNVIEAISKGKSELYEFIEFSKVYVIALKIAFRCDRQAAWELLGIYLRQLEKIALWRRRYNERLDEVSKRIKETSSTEPLNERLKIILDEASKLKEELEEDYRRMLEKRNEKLEGKPPEQEKK